MMPATCCVGFSSRVCYLDVDAMIADCWVHPGSRYYQKDEIGGKEKYSKQFGVMARILLQCWESIDIL